MEFSKLETLNSATELLYETFSDPTSIQQGPNTDRSSQGMTVDSRSATTADKIASENLQRWQRQILIAGLLAYTGYYFLRTDLIVCLNTILKSMPGVDKAEFGTILSFGYILYAGGKVFHGILVDKYGGAPIFIGGLVGSILASLVLNSIQLQYDDGHKLVDPKGTLALFGTIWSLNRAAQSAGWGALVKTLHSWFPTAMHGRVLGIASLSYGVGDVLIRVFLGGILISTTGPTPLLPEQAAAAWKNVFYVAIGAACLLILPAFFWFKSSPDHVPEFRGINVDELSQASLLGANSYEGEEIDMSKDERPRSSQAGSSVHMIEVLRFLFTTPKFWTLLVMSPCLTLIRETFISWTAVFLSDSLGIPDGDAAMLSMLIPLFGTFSTLFGGWAVDRARPSKRGMIPAGCLCALTLLLVIGSVYIPQTKSVADSISTFNVCLLLSFISLSLMAPFSFVDGLFVLSLAGKHAGLAVGIINCVGYTGAILAGHEMGSLAQHYGWYYVFRVLSGISTLTFFMSLVYWWLDLRDLRRLRGMRGRSPLH